MCRIQPASVGSWATVFGPYHSLAHGLAFTNSHLHSLVDGAVAVLSVKESIEDAEVAVRLSPPLSPSPVTT